MVPTLATGNNLIIQQRNDFIGKPKFHKVTNDMNGCEKKNSNTF